MAAECSVSLPGRQRWEQHGSVPILQLTPSRASEEHTIENTSAVLRSMFDFRHCGNHVARFPYDVVMRKSGTMSVATKIMLNTRCSTLTTLRSDFQAVFYLFDHPLNLANTQYWPMAECGLMFYYINLIDGAF